MMRTKKSQGKPFLTMASRELGWFFVERKTSNFRSFFRISPLMISGAKGGREVVKNCKTARWTWPKTHNIADMIVNSFSLPGKTHRFGCCWVP